MEKQDWATLGFEYVKTKYRYVSNYRAGAWDAGCMSEDAAVLLSESAGVLQYAQTCFEGLKAYETQDGRVVTFRPQLNAERMERSARGLEIPPLPQGRFLEAVRSTVRANRESVPPYGTGASLYLRPCIFATGAVLGVKPAAEYQFRVFAAPVGSYFKGGVHPLSLRVSARDRAAPRGTGSIKAGLNYAMSLHNIAEAHRFGFDENLYPDPATRSMVEETGGANLLFVTKDGVVVTPCSDSILPSVTRRSLLFVAREYLGLQTQEREVPLAELREFAECGLCGTAAVIAPVGRIVDGEEEILLPSGMQRMGPVLQRLRETLIGIQMGSIAAPDGWLDVIC